MSVRTLRLMLGSFFLIMAVLIFARGWLFPEFANRLDPLRMNIGGVFALVFGGVNLVKWYAAREIMKSRQIAVRYPLQRDPSTIPPVAPIPEFDFTKETQQEKLEGEQPPREARQ